VNKEQSLCIGFSFNAGVIVAFAAGGAKTQAMI
jgi:hypothetical protein